MIHVDFGVNNPITFTWVIFLGWFLSHKVIKVGRLDIFSSILMKALHQSTMAKG